MRNYALLLFLPLLFLGCEKQQFIIRENNEAVCTGTVYQEGKKAQKVTVKAYEVLDLESQTAFLAGETETDKNGRFSLTLPADSLYLIRAGVSGREWQAGQGYHGTTLIDLSMPVELDPVTIRMTKQ